MDLILQDLDKIDQFHHNYEMMTHGETSRPGFYKGFVAFPSILCRYQYEPTKATTNVTQTMQC